MTDIQKHSNYNHSNSIKKSGLISRVSYLLFFLLLFLAGVAIIYSLGVAPFYKLHYSEKFLKTPCKIIHSKVNTQTYRGSYEEKMIYILDIKYEYVINDKSYQGNIYSFSPGSSRSKNYLLEIASKYNVGMNTVCYVNPDNFSDAVLSKEILDNYLFGLIGVPFLIVGILGLYSIINGFFSKKEPT